MPAMPPPVADERTGIVEFLAAQQRAFHAISHGLTDAQARLSPSASALSIGGLIKHVTNCQRGWTKRVAAAPDVPPADPRSIQEQAAQRDAEFVMGEDETLAGILEAFDVQNAETIRLAETADLDAAVPVPQDVPWFPKDLAAWSVRWVLLHLVEELARHAGHGDVIRETIDGATLYELLAAIEGRKPTPWLTPWGSEPVGG